MKTVFGILCLSISLCFSSIPDAHAQTNHGSPEVQSTVPQIDTLNTLLRRLGRLTKTHISLAETTSTLSRRNISLSENLILVTKSNWEISERLVQLAEENRKSSEQLNHLTSTITALTWVICIVGAVQIILYVIPKISKRSLPNNTSASASGKESMDDQPRPLDPPRTATNQLKPGCSL